MQHRSEWKCEVWRACGAYDRHRAVVNQGGSAAEGGARRVVLPLPHWDKRKPMLSRRMAEREVGRIWVGATQHLHGQTNCPIVPMDGGC